MPLRVGFLVALTLATVSGCSIGAPERASNIQNLNGISDDISAVRMTQSELAEDPRSEPADDLSAHLSAAAGLAGLRDSSGPPAPALRRSEGALVAARRPAHSVGRGRTARSRRRGPERARARPRLCARTPPFRQAARGLSAGRREARADGGGNDDRAPADLFRRARKDSGRRCDIEAGMAKLLAARVAWSNADNALQSAAATVMRSNNRSAGCCAMRASSTSLRVWPRSRRGSSLAA